MGVASTWQLHSACGVEAILSGQLWLQSLACLCRRSVCEVAWFLVSAWSSVIASFQ